MTETEIEEVFAAGGRALRLARLTEPSGRSRIVEPYMIFRSTTGKRLLHVYQLGGYSAGGVPRGWKNVEVAAFDAAQLVERRFTPRAEYNPYRVEMFPEVLFAVAARGGAGASR